MILQAVSSSVPFALDIDVMPCHSSVSVFFKPPNVLIQPLRTLTSVSERHHYLYLYCTCIAHQTSPGRATSATALTWSFQRKHIYRLLFSTTLINQPHAAIAIQPLPKSDIAALRLHVATPVPNPLTTNHTSAHFTRFHHELADNDPRVSLLLEQLSTIRPCNHGLVKTRACSHPPRLLSVALRLRQKRNVAHVNSAFSNRTPS